MDHHTTREFVLSAVSRCTLSRVIMYCWSSLIVRKTLLRFLMPRSRGSSDATMGACYTTSIQLNITFASLVTTFNHSHRCNHSLTGVLLVVVRIQNAKVRRAHHIEADLLLIPRRRLIKEAVRVAALSVRHKVEPAGVLLALRVDELVTGTVDLPQGG